jgi:hypothetical protein
MKSQHQQTKSQHPGILGIEPTHNAPWTLQSLIAAVV